MPRIMTRILLGPLALTLLASLLAGEQSPPDLILLNGKIFTSDAAHPYVEALAIRGERIIATGTSEKIGALAGPQTKRIDLGGRVVIPGINDAHHHCGFEPAGFHLQFKSTEPTWAEVVEEVATAVAKTPKGTLIHGEIGPVAFEDSQANRMSLDKIAPDHPVMLDTWAQHGGVLNSAAFAKFGVQEDVADPVAGHFVRTVDGKLTGVVYEYAKFRINRRRSDMATEEEVLQQTRKFFQDAVKLGITSVQDLSMPGGAERCVMASRKAPTPIRMRVIRMAGTTVNGRDNTEGRTLPLHAAPLITVSGTKWLLDGSPIERTAALRKPYTDLPSTSGELDFPEKEMEAMLRESLQNDDQLLVHATGDRATEMFLNAMDATGGPKVWASKRVRIEHGDGIMPELMARVKGMGLIVVENPTHLTLRELFVRRFGMERTDQMQPMRSLLDAGIPLAIGSDGPNNPYVNIMLASIYPGKPKEAITREQAVIAYTLTSAYAEFAEKDKGSLEPGKFADLVVLSQDIFSVPPPELPKTDSVLTMVGGKIVYDAKALSTSAPGREVPSKFPQKEIPATAR
jgi:predicted amidohydrolase YtcJ